MSRRRSKIHARIPTANENKTISAGNKILVESAFDDIGFIPILDGLRRSRGNYVAAGTVTLVAK